MEGKARGGGGEKGKRRRRGEKFKEAMEGLLLTLRVMCPEGDAPSSTRDLVGWVTG